MKASEWEELDGETWSRTFREAQAPVLADLARAGLKLRSADDLQHVALPSRGDQRARPLIEPYLDHPEAAWRKVARTALDKLDRAAHKQSQRNKR